VNVVTAIYSVTDDVCFCCVRFSFSLLSQEIGWAERLRNNLLYVGWDVTQSVWTAKTDSCYFLSYVVYIHSLSFCDTEKCVQ